MDQFNFYALGTAIHSLFTIVPIENVACARRAIKTTRNQIEMSTTATAYIDIWQAVCSQRVLWQLVVSHQQ